MPDIELPQDFQLNFDAAQFVPADLLSQLGLDTTPGTDPVAPDAVSGASGPDAGVTPPPVTDPAPTDPVPTDPAATDPVLTDPSANPVPDQITLDGDVGGVLGADEHLATLQGGGWIML